jgi:transcriptional regulator with XRE-family HTH domain
VKVRSQQYLSAFGNNLKSLIASKGKTPEEVAALGDIETKQVYRAINAERSITLSTLVAIAKGLGVPPKKLLDFDFEFENLL